MIVKSREIDNNLLNSYGDDLGEFIKPIYAARCVRFNNLALGINKLLLPDFADLNTVLDILTDAIIGQKRIIIISDFDADGATACAVIIRSLRLMGAKFVDFLVPNRFVHGYGLSPEIVEIAFKNKNPAVIITVDNGISSFAGVALAKSYGIKVIITDHHLPSDKLPEADAIINPNLRDCNFASKNLCGVGVAFYLCVSLNSHLAKLNYFVKYNINKPNLKFLLDIVALGTVADVVILDQNNRILINAGLNIIKNSTACVGISALLNISKKTAENISTSDLGFAIAPKINAAGRLDDMSIGIRCLLTDDIVIARQYAEQLHNFNVSRKAVQSDMEEVANDILDKQNFNKDNYSICLYDSSYHEGVVGIVAGKLTRQYHCVAAIFAKNDDFLKGSIRSISSVHIKDLLDIIDRKNPNLIQKFGGHSMAAGLTIKECDFNKFKNIFENAIKKHLNYNKPAEFLLTDGILTQQQINLNNAQLIIASGPWGQGFEEPIFYGDFYINNIKIIAQKHFKCELSITKSGIFFNAIAFFQELDKNIKFGRIIYKLSVNHYRGIQSLQLIIEKVIKLQ